MISLLLHASHGHVHCLSLLVILISLVHVSIRVINVISYSLSMPVLTRSQVKALACSTNGHLASSTILTLTGSTDGLLRSTSTQVLTGSNDEL